MFPDRVPNRVLIVAQNAMPLLGSALLPKIVDWPGRAGLSVPPLPHRGPTSKYHLHWGIDRLP